jgi:hypothetical protein
VRKHIQQRFFIFFIINCRWSIQHSNAIVASAGVGERPPMMDSRPANGQHEVELRPGAKVIAILTASAWSFYAPIVVHAATQCVAMVVALNRIEAPCLN